MAARIRTEIMKVLITIAQKTHNRLNIFVDEKFGENIWLDTELVETFQHSDRTKHHRRYRINITIKYEED